MDPIRPISSRDRDVERILRSERVGDRRERDDGGAGSKRRRPAAGAQGGSAVPADPAAPDADSAWLAGEDPPDGGHEGGIDVRV